MTDTINSEPAWISASEVARLAGISEATFHRRRSAGCFPTPIRLSRGCVRWAAATIRDYLRDCETAGHLLPRLEWEQLRSNRQSQS